MISHLPLGGEPPFLETKPEAKSVPFFVRVAYFYLSTVDYFYLTTHNNPLILERIRGVKIELTKWNTE